ncbi:hypothetical protein KK062_09370 [Fulvivirgaceae bacterium PWU5]|jgi:hypothetical protein|uniref:Uncharacterized protein n=1 Tax=Dawidia cretensis TaxID=2782350 RepID=A0AAP2GTM7_9BACT|nr:hypothetical protein [Dawidia cretensis]MBT1708433.1 hypothetical protein [Dawidia cretensis]
MKYQHFSELDQSFIKEETVANACSAARLQAIDANPGWEMRALTSNIVPAF